MLLLTLRGTPTMYYGDELGLRDVPMAPERVRNPWELRVPGSARGAAAGARAVGGLRLAGDDALVIRLDPR